MAEFLLQSRRLIRQKEIQLVEKIVISSMSINKKLYFLGFAIYLFSFLLPAVPLFDEPVAGYLSAYWAFGFLFDPNAFIDYFVIVTANIANLCTILVFVLHFKYPLPKLILFQLIAFLSASYLAVYQLFDRGSLSYLYIGYWNWLFGMFFMLLVMVRSRKGGKQVNG